MTLDVDYIDQFVLSRSLRCPGLDWPTKSLGDWVLMHHPLLPVIDLVTTEGASIGWLIGQAVSVEGGFHENRLQIDSSDGARPCMMELESRLMYFVGRYVVVIIGEDGERLYLDPSGMRAVVYSTGHRTVASSGSLLTHCTEKHAMDAQLAATYDIKNKDNWYPFGLTGYEGIRRLLPNHYLDLVTFGVHRHWPKTDFPLTITSNPEETVAAIAAQLKQTMSRVASKAPLCLSLTAGRDSRMILACCRSLAKEILFFTDVYPDATGWMDDDARRMARFFQLHHVRIEWKSADRSELEEWQIRTGHCVGGRTWQAVATAKQKPPDRINVVGLAGEVGRAFYWGHAKKVAKPRPEWALNALGLPILKATLEASQNWLENVPESEVHDLLDLLYIEQRLGCWAGPALYGHVTNVHLVPFSDRRIFELMFQLPHEFKANQCLANEVIQQEWPEFLRFPFNKDLGWRRILSLRRNCLKQIHRFAIRHPRVLGWIVPRVSRN